VSLLLQLELIHQHLAKAPPRILTRDVSATAQPLLYSLLQACQSITMRLLQKDAENRYQTPNGLLSDLRYVLAAAELPQTALKAAALPELCFSHPIGVSSPVPTDALASALSQLSSFRVGKLDAFSTFRLSQKLYGRERDFELLRQAYAAVCTDQNHNLQRRSSMPSNFVLSDYNSSGVSIQSVESNPVEPQLSVRHVAPQLFLISGYSGIGHFHVHTAETMVWGA
jgi:hypothetical protein